MAINKNHKNNVFVRGLTQTFNSKNFFKATATALGALMLSTSFANVAEAKSARASIHFSDIAGADDSRFHDGPYVPGFSPKSMAPVEVLTIGAPDDDIRFHEGTFVPGITKSAKIEKVTLPPVTAAIIRPVAARKQSRLQLPEAIVKASQLTGVDRVFLHFLAQAESSGNPKAKSSSKTSSAKGAFGFTNNTWLMTLKKYGAEHGYANAADRIVAVGGKYYVPNKKDRNHIMKTMRHDPLCSSLMAAAFTKENYDKLRAESIAPQDIKGTDLYMAHFWGSNGAIKFFNAKWTNPFATAAELFPQAAQEAGNKPIIYKKDGSPRTLDQFYAVMAKKVPPVPVKMSKPKARPTPKGPQPT